MLRIKKLDIFIFKSFLLLFIGTFFICLFIFMMQFLWKYVDDMVGKGLEMSVLAQFFFYSALSLVPASLPLAILLASLITFGNFGERYELLAMKAAGISLLKIMRPLIVFAVFLCCVSFLFQNVIAPYAQVKLYTLLVSMRQKSPELEIPEGVFYDEIPGYNLYVKSKDRNTGLLFDVMIYDTKDGFDNTRIILSDTAKLEMTADKKHLYLHLYSGEMFENLREQTAGATNVPYRRETFSEKHSIIQFDSDFSLVDAGFMSNQSNSKDMRQLQASIDSMNYVNDSIGRKYFTDAMTGTYQMAYNLQKEDTIKIASASVEQFNTDSIFNALTLSQKQKVINSAVTRASTVGNDWGFKSYTITNNDKNIRRHQTEWHNKITLSLSCLIFFFIGAPLGAIIRKGGLGMPVVVSVLIFIFYYIVNNTGYKMARDGNWIVWIGMWTSTAVLAPIGAFLTYKSNRDSVVLNADVYVNWFKRVAGIRSVRNMNRKEVIIHDPEYDRILLELPDLSAEARTYIDRHHLKKAPNYLRLWTGRDKDEEIISINTRLEEIVEELSNTKSVTLLTSLNKYPIIPPRAHVRPFSVQWLNIAAGVIFPVGLFFYFRVWAFRLRLNKDLEQIIKVNEEIKLVIEKNKTQY